MATINQEEIIASIQLLAHMAKADGKLLEEEREGLIQSLESLALLEGITVDQLLSETPPLEEILKKITSETARESAYQAAYLMAHIDGNCCSAEQKILDRIAEEFAGFQPFGYEAWLENLETRANRSDLTTQMRRITDTNQRQLEVEQLITDACFFAAVFGAFPIPGVAIILDLLIYWNQLSLVQTIGEKWGYTAQNEDLKKALFGSWALTGARIAFSNVAKLVPILGSVTGAAAAYATTWAIGKAANKYYAEGGKIDKFELLEAFKKAKQEGEARYQQQAEAITARQKELQPQIEQLTQDLRSGKISVDEYRERLDALRSPSS